MTVTRFVISPALLGGLAGLVPGEKSPLSPLHIPNPPELTPEQHEDLFEAGMLDQNGLVEPARLMLAALSEAPSFARVRLNSPTGYMDEAIHFTGEGTATVGISNTPDGLELSSPGDAESIFSQIKDFTGSSSHEVPVWSVELLPLEMLCLAALMDLRRKAVLHAIVDQQPVVPLPCDVSAITEAIQSMWGNPQWLTNAIQNATAIRTPPAAALVQAALSALVDKKQAWHQSGNYYPIPEAIQTSDRFLLISTVVHLDTGSANMQGRFTLLRQTWLQTSVPEMLNISQERDNLRLQLVSPAAALEKIHFYLTNFDAVPAPPIAAVDLALAIQAGIGAGKIYPLIEETVVGRSEQATIHILDARASRRHAVIRKLTQGYQLTDAGSTNGTYLNGELLSGPSWLHEGDMISIGETQIKVIRSGDIISGVSSGVLPISAQMPVSSTPSPTTPQPAEEMPVLKIEKEGTAEQPEESLPETAAEPAPLAEMVEEIEPLQAPSAENTAEPAPQEPILEVDKEPGDAQSAISAVFTEPEVIAEPVYARTIDPAVTADLGEETAGEVVLCERCGHALPPEALVCANCGQPVAPPMAAPEQPPEKKVCPQCGNEVNPNARFCGACGNKLKD